MRTDSMRFKGVERIPAFATHPERPLGRRGSAIRTEEAGAPRCIGHFHQRSRVRQSAPAVQQNIYRYGAKPDAGLLRVRIKEKQGRQADQARDADEPDNAGYQQTIGSTKWEPEQGA